MTLTLPSRLPGAIGVLAGGGLIAASSTRATGAELAALALFPIFFAYLCARLRPANAADGWLVTAALCSGLLGIGLKLVSVVPLIAQRHATEGTPLEHALVQLEDFPVVLSLYPLAVFSAIVAVLTLASTALPRWIGVAAGVTALALAANAAFLEAAFVPAFLLFVAWVAATGATLAVRPRTAPVGEPGPAEAIGARPGAAAGYASPAQGS